MHIIDISSRSSSTRGFDSSRRCRPPSKTSRSHKRSRLCCRVIQSIWVLWGYAADDNERLRADLDDVSRRLDALEAKAQR